jgi:hypothetical protein
MLKRYLRGRHLLADQDLDSHDAGGTTTDDLLADAHALDVVDGSEAEPAEPGRPRCSGPQIAGREFLFGSAELL